jgi:hypothetical protein
MYARAREHRAEARADRIDDYIEQLLTGKLDANVARVAIDAEKWQASKEQPKRFGDRTEPEESIPAWCQSNGPREMIEVARRLAYALRQGLLAEQQLLLEGTAEEVG